MLAIMLHIFHSESNRRRRWQARAQGRELAFRAQIDNALVLLPHYVASPLSPMAQYVDPQSICKLFQLSAPSFIKGLRETGIPSRIDKSVLSKLSGSSQSALIAALKWLDLIDAVGVPTPKLHILVDADGPKYSQALRSVLEASYAFMTDGTIDLAKGTGSQLEAKFREYGVQGSTVVKSMAFFIVAARDAGVQLGPHIKAPKVLSNGGAKKRVKKAAQAADAVNDEPDGDDDDPDGIPEHMPGFVKIPIPLHGMEDGAVFLPDNMTAAQWAYALKITKFLIENYRLEEPQSGAQQ